MRAAKPKEYRVLVIEDMPPDVVLINHALRKGGLHFRSKRIRSEQQFLHELEHHTPDVILSDHGIPGFDGFQALQTTRIKHPEIPFLFVSGKEDESAATEALEQGADDYIPKSRLDLLVPAIQRSLHSAADRGRLRQLEVALREAQEQVASLSTQVQRVEQAQLEIEEFATTTGLDLRTPLKHIESLVELLGRSTDLTAKSQSYVAAISSSARQASRLVDDLLTFSRIGQAQIFRLRFSLKDTFEEARRDLWRDTEGRQIEWRIGSLPDISADPSLFLLVMTHLLGNALRFTRPREHALIEIGSEIKPRELVIWVRDNGVGFPMDKDNELFRSFRRAGIAKDLEGPGIGLAIVRRVIERHGGKVWAQGQPDAGATFYFALPTKTALD